MKNSIKNAAAKLQTQHKIFKINRKINGIYKAYKKRSSVVYDKQELIHHKKKWSVLKKRINPRWFKIYSSITGRSEVDYVPEDIYYVIIEPCMNQSEFLLAYKDKNFYEIYYEPQLLPTALLRNIHGVFYDRDYNVLPASKGAEYLYGHLRSSPRIIVKPAVGSSGGTNVQLFERDKDGFTNSGGDILSLDLLKRDFHTNFIVQEYIEQHDFFSQFNRSSLNTVRLTTYRSVSTEEIIVIQAVQRMGRPGSLVDNQASGGLSVGIQSNGRLGDYAVDKYGNTYREFGSGIPFDHLENVIQFEEMKILAKGIARKNYYARLLGFDFCVDKEGTVRLIEINNKYLEINFLQMNNGPLFGSFTDEVIEFCLSVC